MQPPRQPSPRCVVGTRRGSVAGGPGAGRRTDMQVICVRLVTGDVAKAERTVAAVGLQASLGIESIYRDGWKAALAPFVREWGSSIR